MGFVLLTYVTENVADNIIIAWNKNTTTFNYRPEAVRSLPALP